MASTTAPSCPSSEQEQEQEQQKLSINDLVRHHCRVKLLVQPILWTQLHLELLRCSFDLRVATGTSNGSDNAAESSDEPLEWADSPSPKSPSNPPPSSVRQTQGSSSSSGTISASPRYPALERPGIAWVLRNLRNDEGDQILQDITGPILQFHFGGRIIRSMRYSSMFSLSDDAQDSQTIPSFAVVRLDIVDDLRDRILRLNLLNRTGRFPNDPVDNLGHLRVRRLRPTDEFHDPYAVAMIIAMAQAQASWCRRRSGKRKPSGFDTHLVVRPRDNRTPGAAVRVLAARVSRPFLAKLDRPASSRHSDAALVVHETVAPYDPPETLSDRLRDALGLGSLGLSPPADSAPSPLPPPPSSIPSLPPKTGDDEDTAAGVHKRKRKED